MPNEDDKYRAHVYFGSVIEPIIRAYAKAQGVTFGTIVRRLCYMSLFNEISSRHGEYKPMERKKEWK